MPHTSWLAFWPPLVAAVVFLVKGSLWFAIWWRTRVAYVLPSAITAWGLCAYFFILSITAGAAPALPRSDIAVGLRVWLLLLAAVVVAGIILLVRVLWINGRVVGRRESSAQLKADEKEM